MAQRKTKPRLVVKIVGSKQMKQFMEEPEGETEGESVKRKEQQEDETPEREVTEVQRPLGSGLWAVIHQVPDRQCVTAPPCDRSRSFIHLKATAASDDRNTTQQSASSRGGAQAELLTAVREQLSDWPLASQASIRVQAAALDGSSGGTLDRSTLALLFLEDDVPLRMPTFSLLLQIFSDQTNPGQVNYRELFQFIRAAAFPQELHTDAELKGNGGSRQHDHADHR